MTQKTTHSMNIRLSIARHGRAGWQWTMLLTSEDEAEAAAAQFRSDEDGRGTWMRMIGDEEWIQVTPPDQRAYPADEHEARAEITEVCVHAAADLLGRRRDPVAPAPRRAERQPLADMVPMGRC